MPRLFTGLKIPEQLADELSLLRGGIYGARWIEPDDYHITLSFIGDIDSVTADEVVLELETIHASPFSVRISGFDSFGSKSSRAIFASIETSPDLNKLQKAQDSLLRRMGISMQSRKYVPHITLARSSQAKQSDITQYLSVHGGFTSEPFEISQFILFSAKGSIGGGPYHSEVVYEF